MVNDMVKRICCLCLGWLVSGAVLAEKDAPADCSDPRTATEIVEQGLREWEQGKLGKALNERDSRGELVLLIGRPILVAASVDSASFGKSREMAYAKSFLDTQQQFIQRRSTSIQTETAAQYFDAAPSQEDLEFQQGKEGALARIGKKVFLLTEAKLNKALREAGVPEDKITEAEFSRKVQTYRDSLTRKSVSKAFGELSGIVPVKNIEATDCNNLAAVATVSVFSGKTLSFVKDVITGRPILADADRAGQNLHDMVREEIDSGDIVYNFGLRRVYDEAGYPSFVSYGQWSYVAGGLTPRQRERKKRTAVTQAEQNARAAIAQFLNSSGQAVVQTLTEERVEEFVKVFADRKEQASMTELVEKVLEDYSAKANVKVTGLRKLADWSMPYPDKPDVMLVGVVLSWSPRSADAIERATGRKGGQAASQPVRQSAPAGGKATLRGSKDRNDAADF